MENELNEILQQNSLIKINPNLYITKYQKDILEKHNIPFQSCQNPKELIFLLQDVLDEDDDLEEILAQISEFDYYQNTQK